jgi:hypothetical protein
MNDLRIAATDNSPEVIFDINAKKLKLKGICTAEDPKEIFDPVFAALDEYLKKNKALLIEVYLNYFNTSSSKYLLYLFLKVSNKPEIKPHITVNWVVDNDDSDLEESGFIFEEITGLKFNYSTGDN